jgi:hypothetical protein
MKDVDYYNSLDKRSKEYKDWKKSQKAEGLGDVVEKITEATGIKKAVKWLAGDDCGCDERKEKLNNLFPSRWKADCLQEDEYKWLDNWFKLNKSIMKPTEQKEMLAIYNRVFNARQQFTTCSSCLRDIMNRMRKVYETYEDANT